MRVNYDENTKKFTVDISLCDRLLNLLIVIIICCCVLCGVFKPDIKSIFMSGTSQKPAEEDVVFTSGNQLSWQEYRAIIGNKKLMKQYAKRKKTVTGYMPATPAYDGRQYVAAILESADTTDSTIFVIMFSHKAYAESLKVGVVTITSDYFSCADGYAYLCCYNPIVVNESTKG